MCISSDISSECIYFILSVSTFSREITGKFLGEAFRKMPLLRWMDVVSLNNCTKANTLWHLIYWYATKLTSRKPLVEDTVPHSYGNWQFALKKHKFLQSDWSISSHKTLLFSTDILQSSFLIFISLLYSYALQQFLKDPSVEKGTAMSRTIQKQNKDSPQHKKN